MVIYVSPFLSACAYAVTIVDVSQVVDGHGNIAGLLSIAKCLYDAIHRLEKKAMRAEEKGSPGGDGRDLAATLLKVCMWAVCTPYLPSISVLGEMPLNGAHLVVHHWLHSSPLLTI